MSEIERRKQLKEQEDFIHSCNQLEYNAYYFMKQFCKENTLWTLKWVVKNDVVNCIFVDLRNDKTVNLKYEGVYKENEKHAKDKLSHYLIQYMKLEDKYNTYCTKLYHEFFDRYPLYESSILDKDIKYDMKSILDADLKAMHMERELYHKLKKETNDNVYALEESKKYYIQVLENELNKK